VQREFEWEEKNASKSDKFFTKPETARTKREKKTKTIFSYMIQTPLQSGWASCSSNPKSSQERQSLRAKGIDIENAERYQPLV